MPLAKTYLGPIEPQYEEAPDETWSSRDTPPPAGVLVEAMWPGRGHRPDQYGKAIKEAKGNGWLNRRGEQLLFNPSFWRHVSENGANIGKGTDPKPGTAGGLLAQWDEPVPAGVLDACEQAVDAFECEDHDYVYDPHNRRHYCKHCDQDPPKEAIKNWPNSHRHECSLCFQIYVCWNPYKMSKKLCENDCTPICMTCLKRESK